MYKNFNITEQERKQIMEMHQTHGYKKPLNEDESMDDNGSEQDMTPSNGLIVEDHIYIPIENFTVYVTYKEEDGHEEVPVYVSRDENTGNPVFDVNENMMPEGGNPEDFINAVKQKMGENPFESLNYNGAVLNYETGETENF